RSWSGSGLVAGNLDVGSFENVHIELSGPDEQGRPNRNEVFASDHLGDAVARLYERYAERLPDGPERTRAAAAARTVAAYLGPLDLDRMAAVMAPGIEFVDHRPVGFVSVHGREEIRTLVRTLLEAADDVADRADDVLDLRSGALLLRVTNLGTEHAGGGRFERPMLRMWVFDGDGLATHV